MKKKKIKLCVVCGERPGVNYDGRYICVTCWRKSKGRYDKWKTL